MSGAGPGTLAGSVRRRPDVLWRCAGSTAILLAPDSEVPVIVGGSGAALWESLADPVCGDAVVQSLADQFGVDPEVVRADVERSLCELSNLGLLEPA